MDRAQLFDALSHLSPQDFERLLVAVNMPRMNRAGASAKIGEQVSAFLEWADSRIGPGVEAIARHSAELNCFEFDAYLRSLIATYEKWWEHYTITDAVGKVEQVQPEQSSVFDFGLMVQTVTKEREPTDPENTPLQQDKEKTERLPVLEGIRKYADDHVLLVGRPGSGKSTALIRLLLEEATLSPNPSPKIGKGGQERIPVLVELRYWQTSVLERIRAFLHQHDPHLNLDDAALSALLRQGRFLLLIDGLNELPSDEARNQLTTFRRDHPKVPMIFTTRDLGLGGDLGIEKKLEMQPLTEAQMNSFICAYVPDQAEVMLRQLSDRLREFGQTPLLLWMLCQLFQQTAKIPENLGLVFRLFTQQYEGKLKSDGMIESDRGWWNPVLRQLAWVMMQGKTPTDFRVAIPQEEAVRAIAEFLKEKVPYAEDFARKCLRDLQKHHLIQADTSSQELEFRHQLIQEYYAAEHLRDLLPGLSDEQLKRDYLNLLKWTEAIALMLALTSDDAQALRVVKLALSVDLMLGARLSGETVERSQEYTTQLVKDAVDVSELFRVALLRNTKSKYVVSALKLFLLHENSEIRQKAMSAFGEIKDSSAINAISHMIDDENQMVRGELAMTLGKIGTEFAGLKLKEWRERLPNENPYVDIRRQTALWDIYGDEEKPALFRSVFDDDDSDDDDFYESSDLSHSNIDIDLTRLAYAAKHENPHLRRFAVGELRNHRKSDRKEVAFELLVSLVDDSDHLVQQAAFRELQYYLGTPCRSQVVNVFLEQAKDPSSGLQFQALERIEKYYDLIDKEEIDRVLIDAANSPDFLIRLISIKNIEKRAEAVFLTVLHKALNDEKEIRRKAAKVLGEIGHPDSSQKLVQAMTCHQDDDTFIEHAIKALGSIGGSLAIETLGRILLQGNGRFTGDILEALGDTKDPLAAPFLLEVKLDSHQSSSSWLELKRVNALGKTADGDLLSSLKKTLQTVAEKDLLEELLTAILRIQDRCKFYSCEIWQAHLSSQQDENTPSQSDKTIASTITIQTVGNLTIMSDKAPIFNQQNATIGVNYAAEGSQQDFTQHIHAPEQNFEILLTGYKRFIDELQQQHPHITNETAIIQTIDIEARRIDTRWQNFLNLKRLWNGGKKAAIKVGEHFVESNPWGKGAIAFLEGVSEEVK